MERHPLHALRYRNERKRILFEKWIQLGTVKIWFDATHPDVALPSKFKTDSDYWLDIGEAEIYTSHVEGRCVPRNTGIEPFQYSVAWDSVHAMYSFAVHEKHTYLEDVDRAKKRHETLQIARTGRPIPC